MERYRTEMHGCTALTGVWNECIHQALLLHPKWGQSLKVVLNIKMPSFEAMMHVVCMNVYVGVHLGCVHTYIQYIYIHD